MRYELTDHEWTAIKPMLPNKPRGVARVNDRRSGDRPYAAIRVVTVIPGERSETRDPSLCSRSGEMGPG